MKLVNEFGPLIESGDGEGWSYEVRGDANCPEIAMVYAYFWNGRRWIEGVTQKGGSPAFVVAGVIIADLKRRAA